ncbi:MAG: hypothetical protein WAN12_08230 [Candidatus Acidiferrum sp.]
MEAKLEKKISATGVSRPIRENKQKPIQRGPEAPNRGKTISRLTKLVNFVVIILAFLGGYVLFRPNVSVDPDLLLNPGDPFSTQFSVTNENVIFDVKDLQPFCRTIHVMTSHNIGMFGLPGIPSQTIPVLSARQKTTITCREWIGGLGAGAGDVLAAYIEIDVSYRQNWWPREKTQRFPFKGVIDSQKAVHWTHITPMELQAALSH